MRELTADLSENAATGDVVRQAGERLDDGDVRHALADHVDHLTDEVPPLASLVAELDDALGVLHQLCDRGRDLEPGRLPQRRGHRLLILHQ